MANNLRLTMALRFVRSRRKGGLTRFISFASTCGIAIGVFAAIVGLSVMNGFEYELQNRVLSLIPSAQLNSSKPYFTNGKDIESILLKDKNIVATAQVVEQKSIISANKAFAPLVIAGINPAKETKVIDIERFTNVDLDCLSHKLYPEFKDKCQINVKNAQWYSQELEKFNNDDRYANTPRIIIGSGIAKKLKVTVGQEVTIVTLDHNKENANSSVISQSLKNPEKHKALVIGIIHIGGQLDGSIALMDFKVLKEIAKLDGANSIHIKTKNYQDTNKIVFQATNGKLKESAYLVTWMNSQGKLYHDIQMVRQIMYIAMFLVLAVSCFNIVSNLLLMVGEKRREIAILLTMGMKPREVVKTFSLMGLISGGYGAIIGMVLGIVFSLVLTPFTKSFKDWFGFDLLNEEVYFINFIPCHLSAIDVIFVLACSLLMSFLAALYPAMRASKVKPAQELNL
ncbi:FtsX-like permease family protein [Anaerobiospirillum sp. NML120448]|uniref:FtsX-like permease family protein n=1 Tax=Anaerobiospirillum sp. NML120448 TaxID=2932816 RepID=UPI001FF30FEF|nr:FtsX-like permease family protein [Anaerobiospirillum sp. NML120448]